jgi:hypothetical protein
LVCSVPSIKQQSKASKILFEIAVPESPNMQQEISVNSGGQTVSVMRHNETLQPMHIGGSTTFDFPTTTSVSSISTAYE